MSYFVEYEVWKGKKEIFRQIMSSSLSSVFVLFVPFQSLFTMKLIFSFISPSVLSPCLPPSPAILSLGLLLTVASNFAIFFEQTQILPTQLFSPLLPSFLFFAHPVSGRLCPLLQRLQPHVGLPCLLANF